MKEELGLMPALQERILLRGSQSRTAWIYSSGGKGTNDGRDKCFVKWMQLKTEKSADLKFHTARYTSSSCF